MLITVEGQMGSGKTLTSTMFGWDAQKKGRKILANYKLRFPYTSFEPEDLYRLNEAEFQLDNCMFLLDEGYLVVDSRNSMTKMNRLFNYWAVQTRKRQVDVIIATHEFKRLDARLRYSIGMRIGCKYNKGVEKPLINRDTGKLMRDNRGRIVVEMDEDGYPIYLRSPSLKLNVRNFQTNRFSVKRIPDVDKFFRSYNTNEIVEVPEALVFNKEERKKRATEKENKNFMDEALTNGSGERKVIKLDQLSKKDRDAIIARVLANA